MDANESFEMAAEAFYKATGMLMPGKDIAAACGWTEECEEERCKAFKVWCAAVAYMQKSESTERNELRQSLASKTAEVEALKAQNERMREALEKASHEAQHDRACASQRAKDEDREPCDCYKSDIKKALTQPAPSAKPEPRP